MQRTRQFFETLRNGTKSPLPQFEAQPVCTPKPLLLTKKFKLPARAKVQTAPISPKPHTFGNTMPVTYLMSSTPVAKEQSVGSAFSCKRMLIRSHQRLTPVAPEGHPGGLGLRNIGINHQQRFTPEAVKAIVKSASALEIQESKKPNVSMINLCRTDQNVSKKIGATSDRKQRKAFQHSLKVT